MTVTIADKLSVFPILQQVVGVATIVSSLVRLIYDLAKFIFNLIIARVICPYIFSKDPEMLVTAESNLLASELRNTSDDETSENVKGLWVGLVRAIPIAGSIYSAVVWYKADPDYAYSYTG